MWKYIALTLTILKNNRNHSYIKIFSNIPIFDLFLILEQSFIFLKWSSRIFYTLRIRKEITNYFLFFLVPFFFKFSEMHNSLKIKNKKLNNQICIFYSENLLKI